MGTRLADPTLQNEIVVCRPFKVEDVAPVYEAVRESLTQLSKWMIWCHHGYSIEDTLGFISKSAEEWAQGTQYSFAVLDPRNGGFLGSVGLSAINKVHGCANLGYWVRTARTRFGVATGATRLVAKFGLRSLGLQRLELLVPAGNKASLRVAEKAGAKWEGVLRKRLCLNGAFHDAAVYSLTASDLE
jgi:ribosomal-protein-serine acetyltransferase